MAIKIINTTLAFLKISVFSSLVLDLLKQKKLICLFNRQQSKDLTHVRRPVLSMRYNRYLSIASLSEDKIKP